MGVIFESDEDFGEIEFCPAVGKIADSEKEISNLDLSYLSGERADKLRALLMRHAVVFSDKPGCCKTFEHEINLVEGFEPKRQRPYRIPEKLKVEVDRQLDQLLLDGKIRPLTAHLPTPFFVWRRPTARSDCV